MRKRVLEKLPDAGEIAHRLRIQTIDAFCASLTRQVPVLARFGAQPGIVEDASGLYLEAAWRRSSRAWTTNPASQRLLAHLDNDVARRGDAARRACSRKRDQWLRKTGRAAHARRNWKRRSLSERNRLLAQGERRCMPRRLRGTRRKTS